MANASQAFLRRLPDVLPSQFNFEHLADEVEQASIPWRRHYGEYQSGGWWTCTLLGRSTDATDGEVTDFVQPKVTGALESLPVMRGLLRDMRLQYMMARLARLDPRGALWEHRDYQDLRQTPRQRIHLPLDTNADSIMVAGGQKYHMELASLWTFRPTSAHGVQNSGSRPRVHLILDVYEDEYLKQRLAQARPSPPYLLPTLSAADLAKKVKALRSRPPVNGGEPDSVGLDDLMGWERSALGLYFTFTVPEGEIYNSIEQACRDAHDLERAAFWTTRRRLMLGKGLVDA